MRWVRWDNIVTKHLLVLLLAEQAVITNPSCYCRVLFSWRSRTAIWHASKLCWMLEQMSTGYGMAVLGGQDSTGSQHHRQQRHAEQQQKQQHPQQHAHGVALMLKPVGSTRILVRDSNMDHSAGVVGVVCCWQHLSCCAIVLLLQAEAAANTDQASVRIRLQIFAAAALLVTGFRQQPTT